MKLYRYIILLLALFPSILIGQVSEEAQQLYDKGLYKQAKIALEKDFEENPTHPTINYLLGVAAMHSGDIETAEQALAFAKSKRVQDATLYLGRVYAMLYKFEAAEKEFTAYERLKRRNKEALKVLEETRDYADKLQRMVNRTEDIQIIDSVVVAKADFLKAYNLSASGGSLQWARDFFDSYENNIQSVVYMNERKTKVHFSRPVSDRGNKLYTMEKLLDNFGNEKMLPSPISNNEGNQDYPFILADGLTIYFASEGHESIGGYDLFVSRYNLNSNSYLAPSHMNMPFNSPFNDYMMVIDEQKGVGWFASDRYQPVDKVCVYTFIPNQEVRLVQTEEPDSLANRAKISNIKETWRNNEDYSNLILQASAVGESEQHEENEFELIINNDYTYHRLEDFKSFSARELYIRAIDIKREQEEVKEALRVKRAQYIAASAEGKQSLVIEIKELEKTTVALYDQFKIAEVLARNEEIRHLNSL